MNMKQTYRPLVGLQNSVMAFVDPFHAKELSHRLRRTGDGVDLPVQDGAPTAEQFFRLLEDLGVDFLMQHTMPGEAEELSFVNAMAGRSLKFLMGNEFDSINRTNYPGTNRGDFSAAAVEAAKRLPNFLGLLYDETEHIQLHPTMYCLDPSAPMTWQWADPTGCTLEQAEATVVDSVRRRAQECGCDLFGEHVFPVMHHALARGGLNPTPKVMKEVYQSLQLSTALGAAIQYGRRFGICADLWGLDVGPWFTRKWGFPGHSPQEFYHALRMAWHFSPDFLFVENVDPLAQYNGDFALTEFGEIFDEFIHQYVPEHSLPYRYDQAVADIALVRSDDALFNTQGGFYGHRMYGSLELNVDDATTSAFKAWSLISHGRVPAEGPIWPHPRNSSPRDRFPVTEESVRTLPLEHGVPVDGLVHDLFQPMSGVLAFDEHATARELAPARLIVAAGSRMADDCAAAMLQAASRGATLVAPPWLLPAEYRRSRALGSGRLILTQTYDEPELHEQVDPLLGDPDIWRQRFGDYTLEIRNPAKDGIQLEIEIKG